MNDHEMEAEILDRAERREALNARLDEPLPELDDGWEWMVVEVMGHRRHAGRVREVERFGAKFMRVDVPNKGDPEAHGWSTHFYPPASLFGFTPAEEGVCLKANKPYEPPSRLSLPHRRDDEEGEGDIDMPF